MVTVKYTIAGASSILTRDFPSVTDGARFALRWRSSNSQGNYIAKVFKNGRELAV